MFRHILHVLLLGLCCFILTGTPVSAKEFSFPTAPQNREFVMDLARVLPPHDKIKINETLSALMQNTGAPVIVVTLPTLGAYGAEKKDAEAFARALFNRWGIGSAKTNNGVLFLISIQERTMRIQMGSGYGTTLDKDLDAIRDAAIIPAFKVGNYPKGVIDGCEALAALIKTKGLLPSPEGQTPSATPVGGGVANTSSNFFESIVGEDGPTALHWVLIVLLLLLFIKIGANFGWGWGAFGFLSFGLASLWGFFVSGASSGSGGDGDVGGGLGGGDFLGGGGCDGGGGTSGDW